MTKNEKKITLISLFDRDTLLHLRLPFSFFLLPIFLFGISQARFLHLYETTIVFIALHIFIYPGSNIYNSYMDKDTGSIGGLKNPPPVTRKLYYMSILFDAAGLLLCSFAGWQHMLVLAGYVAFSKAYSWHGIRLKKYGVPGWISVAFFQGGYTFMLANMAVLNQPSAMWFTAKNIECMLFASLIIGGSYPLTQIYQHDEDGGRGDKTISYLLGIKGTFIFSSVFFVAGSIVALHYFSHYYSINHFLVFFGCSIPVVLYFASWFSKAMKNLQLADYEHSMLMNRISSISMIICFTILSILNLH